MSAVMDRVMEYVEPKKEGSLPLFRTDPLLWRNELKVREGLRRRTRIVQVPQLALLDWNAHELVLKSERRAYTNGSIHYEYEIGKRWHDFRINFYRDVLGSMSKLKYRHGGWAKLTFGFNGGIPEETLTKIALHQRRFTGVYLLVDAPLEAWKLETSKGTSWLHEKAILADPLVLGRDAVGRFHVIDRFDPTPLEDHAAEFAV